MEIHPGKQTFIDDFFIESMLGTQRVLNPSEKLTVENSIHTVLPEMPWERDEAAKRRREKDEAVENGKKKAEEQR